jgi:hypothetical protein
MLPLWITTPVTHRPSSLDAGHVYCCLLATRLIFISYLVRMQALQIVSANTWTSHLWNIIKNKTEFYFKNAGFFLNLFGGLNIKVQDLGFRV